MKQFENKLNCSGLQYSSVCHLKQRNNKSIFNLNGEIHKYILDSHKVASHITETLAIGKCLKSISF